MNCVEWEERIALYSGGDAREDAAAVEQHLAECSVCSEFAADLQASLTMLREVHDEPLAPAHFTAVRTRVLERLAEGRGAPVWRRAWVWGAAAAMLVAALWIRPQAPPPPPPVVALAKPPAPPIQRVERQAHPQRVRKLRAAKTEPLMIRIVTNDPDVVLYWIADKKGDE